MGRLIGASHKAGAIVAFNLTNMTSTPIVSAYMGKRLNSPNDLTVRSDGTIYFTDPDFQAPSPLPAGDDARLPPAAGRDGRRWSSTRRDRNPNGITLSLDETFLFVTDGQGLWRYPVNTDGSTGTATRIAQSAVVDAATAWASTAPATSTSPATSRSSSSIPTGSGTSLGSITVTGVQSVTNIAFGGANHQTLYVTGLGNGMGGSAMGLYRADMPLPGMPF